jgi:hypothetical protein
MTELKSLAKIMIPDGQRLAKLYDNQGNLIWRAAPEVLWTGSKQLNSMIDIKLSKPFGELPNGIVLYGTPRPINADPVSALTPDGGVHISQADLLVNNNGSLYISFESADPVGLGWLAGSLSSNVWTNVVNTERESTYTLLKIVEG